MVTGQAAGVAAALSARSGFFPREVDITALQRSLRGLGAKLHTAEAT